MKVPKDQVVGEVNKGWDVAKYLLGHEREMISGMGLGGQTDSLGAALGATRWPDDPLLRADSPAFDVDAMAFRGDVASASSTSSRPARRIPPSPR